MYLFYISEANIIIINTNRKGVEGILVGMMMGSVFKSSWKHGRGFVLKVFGIALLISLSIVGWQMYGQVQSERSRMELIADEYMNYSQLMLEDIEQNAQFAGALVIRQNGHPGDFSDAAQRIVQSDPAVQWWVALAPKGVLQAGYPPSGNAVGKDILQDERLGAAARWARDHGQLALSMDSDAAVCTAVWPVYLSYSGQRSFWGFVVLDFLPQDFLEQAGRENEASHPAAYELFYAGPWQEDLQCLSASRDGLLAAPLERKSVSSGKQLQLRLSPLHSWLDFGLLGELIFLSLFASAMIAVVAMLFYELHEEKHEFAQQAFTDELTGLLNRRRFVAVLEEACRRDRPFLLCYIDLNSFKAVNDTYGHDIGDLLLRAAAKRLLESLGAEDMLFRIGGDEFVAFVEDPGSEEARRQHMQLFHTNMKKPFKLDGITLDMNISTGYVLYPRDARDSETLLRMADQRMYEQKQRN